MSQDIKAVTKQVDVLPMVKHYITELKLYETFDRLMPQKSNEEMAPAQVLCMMAMNIICASQPCTDFPNGYRATVMEWLKRKSMHQNIMMIDLADV